MRWRLVMAVSVGVNVVLAALVYSWWRAAAGNQPDAALSQLSSPLPTMASNVIKTNVVVRRLHFKWEDIESDDYPTYIANLREIGCPEPTIRDIIVADINQFYAKRQSTEIASPDQQWWRSDPDPLMV